jgi:hypothetical protein
VEGVLLGQPIVQHMHSPACLLKQLLLPLNLTVQVIHQLVGGLCLQVGWNVVTGHSVTVFGHVTRFSPKIGFI